MTAVNQSFSFELKTDRTNTNMLMLAYYLANKQLKHELADLKLIKANLAEAN